MNLAYYALHGINLISVAAAPAWLISVALPVAIALYSHLIVGATHDDAVQKVAPSVKKVARVDAVQRASVQMHAQSEIPETSVRAQALQMRAEEFTVAQIAQQLNVKTSTVRSWLRRKQGSAS
jgi:DNA-directed RNA polymerase specialized sigma24 family protein